MPYVSSRFCLKLPPDIMYRQPRAGLQRFRFPDAGRDAEGLYMPGTSGCLFFTTLASERRQCAKTARILGLDGESAGGKGQR